MDFRECAGSEWSDADVNAAFTYVFACNVARTCTPVFIGEKYLRELPRRFEGAAQVYIGPREFRDALRIAIDKLRRGFHPAHCRFENWFSYTSILGQLLGFRPDHLDSPGKNWSHAQRFDAAKYTFSRTGNLKIYLRLIRGRMRLHSSAQGAARVDRFLRLQKDPEGAVMDTEIFNSFQPAKCCFEFWALLVLMEWILPGAETEKKM
jgi:hypothetical protein